MEKIFFNEEISSDTYMASTHVSTYLIKRISMIGLLHENQFAGFSYRELVRTNNEDKSID